MSNRLREKLTALKGQNHAGFVPFIMAGDPSVEVTAETLAALPQAGADIIELGMPFSDPTADGPTIQAAGQRALKAGFRLEQLFDLVRGFRMYDSATPLILMGYANPVFHTGVEYFMQRAADGGADGLILVDIPAEERAPYQKAAKTAGLSLIPLIAPTSLHSRLALNCDGADGFVYYISIKGITGTRSADRAQLEQDIGAIRGATELPVAAGFGIKSAEDVAAVSRYADLVVVGSAIVKEAEAQPERAQHAVIAKVKELAAGIQPR